MLKRIKVVAHNIKKGRYYVTDNMSIVDIKMLTENKAEHLRNRGYIVIPV